MRLLKLFVLLAGVAMPLYMLPAVTKSEQMDLFNYPIQAKAQRSDSTTVEINPAIKSADAGQTLSIKLPNGDTHQLIVQSNERKNSGSRVIIAQGEDDLQLIMTVGKRATFASLNGPDMTYAVGFDPDSGLFIADTKDNEASVNYEGDMRFAPGSQQRFKQGLPKSKARSSDLAEQQSNTASAADMTLLVVYSPEFGVGMGDPDARIEQLVAFTNQALANTGVEGQFRLVGAVELDFNNNLGIGTILDQATCLMPSFCANTPFAGLANLRDSVGADMVAVLSFVGGFSAAGVAWVNGDSPAIAYSSTRLSPGCCDSVFAHELGHNLGSGHERDSVNPTLDSCDDGFQPGGFTGFSCGFGQSGNFGTIMSRIRNGTRINRFSNPNQSCNGTPCGISQGQANAADNFTSFNTSVFLIEQFRPNVFVRPSGNATITPIIPLLLDEDD